MFGESEDNVTLAVMPETENVTVGATRSIGAQRNIAAAGGTGVLTPRAVDTPVPVNRKGQRTVAVVVHRDLLVLDQPLRATAALTICKGEAVRE